MAYRKSQQGRKCFAVERYESFFASGRIDEDLAEELLRLYREKVASGHAFADLGKL
jgi:hypothetical protein